MKLLFTILMLILTTSAFSQLSLGEGCFTYKYIPTVFDSTMEVIPAVTMTIPAVYKDTIITKIIVPAYTEQYLECTAGSMKICNKTHPAIKQCYNTKYMVKPETTIVIQPATTIKVKTIIKAGYVAQVPCK